VHYGTSHLIVYRPERVSGTRRLANRLKLAAEGIRRRIRR
jgi:hypothetical protein